MRALLIWTLSLFATVLFSSCAHVDKAPPVERIDFSSPKNFSKRIRIMEYNVENLFDTSHDEGKNDWEFLPKNATGKKEYCDSEPPSFQARCRDSDWTEEKLEIKLGQIAKVLSKSGPKPDLLALIEVENETVVRKLAEKLGYQEVAVTQSPDERGIDVALIFNTNSELRFLGAKTARVDLKDQGGKPSRDILVAEFEYGAKEPKRLAVFVNHWPSQNNPVKNRRLFAEKVRELALAYSKKNFDILVTGDFNVEPVNDHPNPFLAFMNGDEPFLYDVDRLVRENARKLKVDLSQMPPGTYFYWHEGSETRPPAMTWNLLDRFFISKSLLNNTDLRSYRIVNDPEFSTDITFKRGPLSGSRVAGVPLRYSHHAKTAKTSGFSDHFAIVMEIGFD